MPIDTERRVVNTAIASTVGAVAETLAGNGAVAAKCRMQVSDSPQSLRATTQSLGLKGATAGLRASLYSIVPKRIFAYTVEDALRTQTPIGQLPKSSQGLVSGAMVGAAEGVLFTLARRLATMEQVQGSSASMWGAMHNIVAKEGWRGLQAGAMLNAGRSTVGGMGFFGTVSAVKAWAPDMPSPITGALAGTLGALVSLPLDGALTRKYVSQGNPSTYSLLKDMWQREGARGMMRGASASVARSGASAVNYGVTMALLSWLSKS